MNKHTVSFILAYFLSNILYAASIGISPLSIEMVNEQSASSMNLYNESNANTNLQIRIFEWRQESGNDQLIPTNDIVVSPPFLKLESKESYNLRIVRVNNKPISGEKTYRLIIDELPKPVDSRTAEKGLSILLRSSLPIFIVNSKAVTNLDWNIKVNDGIPYLNVSNIGDRHALLSNVYILDQTENKEYSIPVNTVNGYILGGKDRIYPIGDNFIFNPNHNYKLKININGKSNLL